MFILRRLNGNIHSEAVALKKWWNEPLKSSVMAGPKK